MKLLSEMTRDELTLEMNQKEEELREYLKNNETVEMQYLELSKKIAELRSQMATLKIAKEQGSYNKKRVESELREIKNRYFNSAI